MTKRLITKDLFGPIKDDAYGSYNPYSVYLRVCPRNDLAISAMLRAGESGILKHLDGVEGRDFVYAHAWNEICENGLKADGRNRMAAPSILLEHVDDMVGRELGKHMEPGTRSVTDIDAVLTSLAPLALKIERWLENPRQYVRDQDLPLGTQFMDRSEDHMGTQYLVRMDGWDDMQVMERPPGGEWWRPVGAGIEVDMEMEP